MLNTYVLMVFIFLQLADGLLTCYGIIYTPAGIDYEANPIIVFMEQRVGIIISIFFSKFLAITAGGILYYYKHRKAFEIKVITYIHGFNVFMFLVLMEHFFTLSVLATITGG